MSYLATRQRPSAPTDGSRTITLRDDQPREGGGGPDSGSSDQIGAIHLRGAPRNRPRVVWRDDVVDNEGAGKKKSKSVSALSRSLADYTYKLSMQFAAYTTSRRSSTSPRPNRTRTALTQTRIQTAAPAVAASTLATITSAGDPSIAPRPIPAATIRRRVAVRMLATCMASRPTRMMRMCTSGLLGGSPREKERPLRTLEVRASLCRQRCCSDMCAVLPGLEAHYHGLYTYYTAVVFAVILVL